MSLYNLLHGENPKAPILLKMLNLDPEHDPAEKRKEGKWQTGRYRDIHLNEDGTRIILYTRNGLGNRDHFGTWPGFYDYSGYKEGEDCPCPGCVITYHLPKHPNYVRDWDDDFDGTYAYVEFTVPEEYVEVCRMLATGKAPKTIHEKFDETITEMEEMSREDLEKDPRFEKMAEVIEKLNKGESGVVQI